MATIGFVTQLWVDTDIPMEDWDKKFEVNSIVRHQEEKVGRVVSIDNKLHVLVRVNVNTWRSEIWEKEKCERCNYVNPWYHVNPYEKTKDTVVTTSEPMEVDENVIYVK